MADIKVTTDSGKFIAGARTDSGDHVGDVYLYHNGTNSFIENETGILYVTNKASASLILGTANTTAVTIDNSQNVTIAGDLTVNGNQIFTASDVTDQLLITNTDAGTGTAPDLVLYRNSSSPADNDYIGQILLRGRNDNSQDVSYVEIDGVITDATDGDEDGSLYMFTMAAGSQVNTMTLASGKVGIGGATSPSKNLHIKSTASEDTGIIIENTNNAQNLDIDYWNNAGAVQGRIRYAEGAGDISFFPNASASEPLIIKYDGKIGVGTTAPNNELVVSSSSGPTLAIGRESTIADTGVLGNIVFMGSENSGSNWGLGAQIRAVATQDWTEGSSEGTKLEFFTTDNSSATRDSRVTIDHNGNVGIGETSPQGPLHVRSADSGATVHVSADEIIAEGSANAGISILTGTSDEGAIYFGDSGDNDIGRIRYAHSSNKLDFRVNALINMTLDGTNVGIGETSPDEMLHLTSGTSGKPRIILENTNNDTQGPAIILKKSTTDEADGDELGDISWQAMDENHAMTEFGFIRVTAADVTYDSENGTMGFYTTVNASSGARLKINDDGSITHQGAGGAITTDSDGSTLSFSKDATNTIKTTGASSVIHIIAESNGVSLANSGTSWGSLSDERLKENWSYFDNALDKINTLTKIGTYNPIDRETKKVDEDCVLTGLSADEVKKILPTAITEDEEGYKVLQYQDVFVLMLKSIQELSAKVEALENA